MVWVRIIEDGPNCDGVPIKRGDIVDISAEAAAQKVYVGSAEYVKEEKPEPVVETAEAAPAPETTAVRTTKPKPRTRKST